MEFKNLKGLMKHLSNEALCQKYMEDMRWGGKPVCPHCGTAKPYRLRNGKTFRCSSKPCRKNFSVFVGTVFEGSKVSYSNWLTALYLLSAQSKGISSVQLGKHLGVTQKTAWFILHRLRLIMADKSAPLENTVEIDETYVGGKVGNMNKKKRQRVLESGVDNKTPVMGLLERNGKARLTVIGKNSFKDVVRANVSKRAHLMTDTHLAYQGLGTEYNGHDTVNHSQSEYKRGDVYTNSVEGFFSLFKRILFGTYHQISPKHLQRYCDETTYRFNTRKVPDRLRFDNALSKPEGRLTYKQLIQKAG